MQTTHQRKGSRHNLFAALSWSLHILAPVFILSILAIPLLTLKSTTVHARADVQVSIDKTIQYQEIEGLGGFGAMRQAWEAPPYYDDAFIDRMINDLGISFIRYNVPSAYAVAPGVYDLDAVTTDRCIGEGPSTRTSFEYLKALKTEADIQNQQLSLILSNWSPPAWMKHNNCVYGEDKATNRLIIGGENDMRDELADLYVHYIRDIKTHTGLDVYAISLQNEPSLALWYASTYYTAQELRDLVKVVGKRFKDEGLTTKIFYPEEVSNLASDATYLEVAQNDPEAREYIDAFAVHGYSSDGVTSFSSQSFWQQIRALADKYNLPTWMTETSGYTQDWEGALQLAGSIYTALKYGKLSAWVWWSLSDSVPNTQSMTTLGQPTPLYYASKQFYRYIRPGAMQIESSSSDKDVLVTAFNHREQGTLTSVLINSSDQAKTVQLKYKGHNYPHTFEQYRSSQTENAALVGTVSGKDIITLPARSVTTLYGTSKHEDKVQRPTIVKQPMNLEVTAGSQTTLTVQASGTSPLSYQWYRNGVEIDRAIGSRYAFMPTQDDHGANYTVKVSSPYGDVTSKAAKVTILPFDGALAARAITTPTIDGQASDAVWSTTPSYELKNVLGTPVDLSGSFQVAWDEQNIYFLVHVNDPQYQTGSDVIEIYTAGQNNKTNYYDDNDYQWLLTQNTQALGVYRAGAPTGAVAWPQYGQAQNPQGYTQEIAIPWANFVVTPSAGQFFGLDIDLDQRDASNTRLGKVFWHSPTDDAWHDPSVLGVVQLQA